MKKKIVSRSTNSGKFVQNRTTTFKDLTKSERQTFLRTEANNFSKKFTKVIVQLANE